MGNNLPMGVSDDLDKELRKALKGPGYYERFLDVVRSIAEPLGFYIAIPPYQPNNQVSVRV